MPRKRDFGESESGDHVFTEYGCPCGENWSKDKGSVCPSCGETAGEVT